MQTGSNFLRTTPVVLNLIIINSLVFLAESLSGSLDTQTSWMMDTFALHHYKSDVFEPYQLVTHMFMHGSLMHLIFNMFVLWMFGTMMERVFGSKRFLIFYMICGIGAGLAQLGSYVYNFWEIDHTVLSQFDFDRYQQILRANATVGASGAIMGVLAAFGYLFPNTPLMIIPIPIPIKAKWVILSFIALDIFGAFSQTSGDNVAHLAHVGGAVIGFLIVFFWNNTNKRNFL